MAFGIWWLTSRHERKRESGDVERERLARRLDAYARLCASLYVWPNAARNAFTDPTDRGAIEEYEAAMKAVAVDYGMVVMLGSPEMLNEIQLPMNSVIDAFDGLMARRKVIETCCRQTGPHSILADQAF